MKVVCLGDLNLDIYTSELWRGFPHLTDGIRRSCVYHVGGHGANQAVAAALYGVTTYFVGRIGDDFAGRLGLDFLERKGVRIDFLRIDSSESTGTVIIDPEGRQAPVIVPGANLSTGKEEFAAVRSILEPDDVLLCTLGISLECLKFCVEHAKQLGVIVILDPAPIRNLSYLAEVQDGVQFLPPNQPELLQILDFFQLGQQVTADSVDSLRGMGFDNLLLTRGDGGVLWISESHSAQVPCHKVCEVDSLGAGDSFNGVFAASLCEGKSIESALANASAAAALTGTKKGTIESIPKRNQVMQMVKQVNDKA